MCPPGPSCCSRSVESALARDSVNTFKARLFNVTTSMATELDVKATQVDGELEICVIQHDDHYLVVVARVLFQTLNVYFHCRLCLLAAKQGPAGVPRHVPADLRRHVREQRRGVPDLLQGPQDLLREGPLQPPGLYRFIL